jgi:hypothetical protein
MSISALLKLSQWCQRRLDDQPGEVVCSSPIMAPPACLPQHGSRQEASEGGAASALEDAPCGEAAASESARGSGSRPTQPPSQDGGA